MSDETLAEMLERTADRTEVGAPPMNQMYAAAQRSRRRRGAWTALASAAAVATVIGGIAVLSPDPGGKPSVAEPGLVTPAPGMRLVGIENVVIEVPQEWGTNEVRCGTPQADTVVIDQGLTPACGWSRPAVVSSVKITRDGRDVAAKWEQIEVDGVKASRAEIPCTHYFDVGGGMSDICRSAVEFPEQDVQVLAEVSNPDLDQARAEVDEILSRIRVLPDGQTTIPLRESVSLEMQAKSGAEYVRLLKQMGLEPRVEYVENKEIPDGFAVGVDPVVGTPVKVGEEVTVQITGDAAKNTTAPTTEETKAPGKDKTDGTETLDIPDGKQLVASGRFAFTVPQDWGMNTTECGTPSVNTVLMPVGLGERLCKFYRQPGVQTVEFGSGLSRAGIENPERVQVDGNQARREEIQCDPLEGTPGAVLCSGGLYFIDDQVTLRAASSHTVEATARLQVEQLLSGVSVLPDGWAGVPGLDDANNHPDGKPTERYRDALEDLGFEVAIRTITEGFTTGAKEGTIVEVSPAPGSVLRKGEQVTMTVTKND
ncbi:hypothetical protein BJ980_003471 [Nocardioides daedukensis]|uniref:PASTA domain-containing protein n=1 Tax=Nocardioides daedukensis TaxID=634462 RepID=A0A7Y9S5S8_9ACTN|nr:PASTA domain-containing protein [Nocardioides daedukensis]NYG60548.1 hypothetical protein [Nocardioides daedukensis]